MHVLFVHKSLSGRRWSKWLVVLLELRRMVKRILLLMLTLVKVEVHKEILMKG